MECHEPHTANKPALLDVSVNQICLKCHPRIAQAPHAIGGFTGAGHPLNGKKTYEIDGKKKKLSCVSCHNQHGSASKKLFRFPAKETYDLCENCHKK
jgi:predicted CXXCH cytochrome family protein